MEHICQFGVQSAELKVFPNGVREFFGIGPGLDQFFTACATTSNTLQVTHIDLDEEGDLDEQMSFDLDSGLPENSGTFVYHSLAACAFNSVAGAHTALGAISPRTDKGATDFFFRIINNTTEQVVGGTSLSLPGARANHPAWGCETMFDGDRRQVNFYFDGPGQSAGTTESRVFRLSGAPDDPKVISIGETTDRNTTWADFPNLDLGAGPDVGLQFNALPVGETDDGALSSIEGGASVRYGSIVIPRFFDTFETGSTVFWTSTVDGSGDASAKD